MLLEFFYFLAALAIGFFVATIAEMHFSTRNTLRSIFIALLGVFLNFAAAFSALTLEYHELFVYQINGTVYKQFVTEARPDFVMATLFVFFAVICLLRTVSAALDIWRLRRYVYG
jgi:multisubunit Na+/H+ antiporter MnhG subunit